jgi:peptidoglycan-N-acetylglucosamine deacetylase
MCPLGRRTRHANPVTTAVTPQAEPSRLLRFGAVMDRRRFLGILGAGGATVASAGLGSAVTAKAAAAATQSSREDGTYCVGPHGKQTVLFSGMTEQKVAALTFDDGPNPAFTPKVLDILAAADIPATFFLIGRLVQDAPSLAKRLVIEGHEVGNHTWEHHSAPTLTDARIVSEIDKGTDVIVAATGVTPKWYRPPRGMLTGASVRQAYARGQGVAMWTVDRGPAPDVDEAGVRDHLVSSIHPGAIIDLHDGVGSSSFGSLDEFGAGLVRRRATEIAALPAVIDAWKAAGYRFVTLTELAAL